MNAKIIMYAIGEMLEELDTIKLKAPEKEPTSEWTEAEIGKNILVSGETYERKK